MQMKMAKCNNCGGWDTHRRQCIDGNWRDVSGKPCCRHEPHAVLVRPGIDPPTLNSAKMSEVASEATKDYKQFVSTVIAVCELQENLLDKDFGATGIPSFVTDWNYLKEFGQNLLDGKEKR